MHNNIFNQQQIFSVLILENYNYLQVQITPDCIDDLFHISVEMLCFVSFTRQWSIPTEFDSNNQTALPIMMPIVAGQSLHQADHSGHH